MNSSYDVKPIKYLDAYPKLPVDAPLGCPHVIDLSSLDHEFLASQNYSVADAVATILFKVMPGALNAFLDLNRPKFHYIQVGEGARLDFCIKRDGRMVTVGYLNEKEFGGWDEQQKYRIDGEATEQWTPISYDGIMYQKDTKTMLEYASHRAYSLLVHEPWHGASPGQAVELVCGLSEDRSFWGGCAVAWRAMRQRRHGYVTSVTMRQPTRTSCWWQGT